MTVTLHLSTVLGAKATKQLLDGDSGKGRAKRSAKAPAQARQGGLLRQLLPREARRFIQYRRCVVLHRHTIRGRDVL